MDAMETNTLMRASEVAQKLGLGRSKTYELIAAGRLPTVRIGRSVRVPREALERWIKTQTREAADVIE